MEINCCLEMLPVTETISFLSDSFNLGVKTFAYSIGDPMPEVRQNLSQILAEHPCFLNHRFQARVRCPEKPRLEMANRPSYASVSPKITKALFDRPSTRRLQVHFLQTLKSALMFLRKVLFRVQPDVFRPCQCLISHLLQCPMLIFSYLVDRLDHVCHQMIAVKDNLLLSLGHMLPDRSQIRVPNVHSNCLNFLARLLRQESKIGVQTLFPPAIPHVFHRRSLQIVDYGDVIVPSTSRLLVHSDLPCSPLFPLQSPLDRSLHDMPGLIPTDPQNPRRTQDIARLQHIDRQPLKERREPCFLLRPGQTHLPHPMLMALNSRRPCVQKGHELAAVQVTPGPFRRMIVLRSVSLVLPSTVAQDPTNSGKVRYLAWLHSSLEPF